MALPLRELGTARLMHRRLTRLWPLLISDDARPALFPLRLTEPPSRLSPVAGFTGLFGIVLGFICLIIPIVWLLWLLLRTVMRKCCNCCLSVRTPERSPRAKKIALALSAFFGSACVCGAASVWGAGGVLRHTLVDMSDLLNDEANKLVNGTLTVAGLVLTITPALTALNTNANSLASVANQLNVAAVKLQDKLEANHDKIYGGYERLELGCTLLGAFLILLILLAWLSHVLAPRRPLRYLLMFSNVLQWVFLVVGWVICGVTYVVYLFVSDTCLVIPDALADPMGSGLASVIPCFDPSFVATAQAAVRAPVYAATQSLNGLLHGYCSPNQGGPIGVDSLCNPVTLTGSAYATRTTACAAGMTTSLGSFGATYNATTCPGLAQAQRLGPLTLASTAVGALAAGTPRIDGLLDCSFVADALEIVNSNCPDLKGGARGLFGGLLLCVLGFSPFLCVLVWAWRHAYEPEGAVLVVGTEVNKDELADPDSVAAPATEAEAAPPADAKV